MVCLIRPIADTALRQLMLTVILSLTITVLTLALKPNFSTFLHKNTLFTVGNNHTVNDIEF